MVAKLPPLVIAALPQKTEVKSVAYPAVTFCSAKNAPPLVDSHGSALGDPPTVCQLVLPARNERTIKPVSWVVLLTLAMPTALQLKFPRPAVLVKTPGSTWQYGTTRVALNFGAGTTNPSDALVRDTRPSLALFKVLELRVAYEPALPTMAMALDRKSVV